MRPQLFISLLTIVSACSLEACGSTPPRIRETAALESVPSVVAEEAPQATRITVIGTNDVHGHVERLPRFAGYVAALRRMRREDGGAVLVDGGDMWQGTIASNLAEGAPVVAAYGALGYDGATLGNHEFDYGPAGEFATPQGDCDELACGRRGALRARAEEADFPLLSANIRMRNGDPIDWPGVQPSVVVQRQGVRIGIIGVTTEETLNTTIRANVDDLVIVPLEEAITAEANRLREEGVQVIIVAAHEGAKCSSFDDPTDLSVCDNGHILQVASALPVGLVNVIVAGHTHRGVAHRVGETAIIESFSLGRSFGRVDLLVRGDEVEIEQIHAPHEMCTEDPCIYEGETIESSAALQELIAPSLAAAESLRARSLNVTLESEFERDYDGESALGNALADWMAAVRPEADIALLNAGGVRANLPEGELTYGALYETFPFDNRFATARLRASQFRAMLSYNLQRDGGVLIFTGVRAITECTPEGPVVRLVDERGRAIPDDREFEVITSDYLATTSLFRGLPEDAVEIHAGAPIRDQLADYLANQGGSIRPDQFFDASSPRMRVPGPRPVRCD